MLAACGFGAAVQTLAETITNQGELGVLAAVNGKAVAAYKRLIARAERLAGERQAALLAPGAWPRSPRLWAWPPGDIVRAGQPLELEVRALGPRTIEAVRIHYRPLAGKDQGQWEASDCIHERGSVYRGLIPAAGLSPDGVCYYISATDEGGATATAPLGAPATSFSATVLPGEDILAHAQ